MLRDGHDGPCEPDRREGRRGRTEAEEEGARAAKRGRVAATPGDDKRRPGPGAKYSASGRRLLGGGAASGGAAASAEC